MSPPYEPNNSGASSRTSVPDDSITGPLHAVSTPPTMEDIMEAFSPVNDSQQDNNTIATEDRAPTPSRLTSQVPDTTNEAAVQADAFAERAPPTLTAQHPFDIMARHLPSSPLPPPPPPMEREESAEEVLQASIDYERSTPYSHIPQRNRLSLYPSLYTLDKLDPDYSEEAKEEITDLASTPYAALDQSITEGATVLATTAEDEEMLAAMKRSAYSGQESSTLSTRSQDPEATVVAITDNEIHPSDLSHGAVQAELIGQDYSKPADYHSSFHHSASDAAYSEPDSVTVIEVESGEDTTTEATVIDSAPLVHDGEAPHWKIAEEATVLTEEDVAAAAMDRKPAAVEDFNDQDTDGFVVLRDVGDEEFAVADQEAEIVDIQEEIHPSEFVAEADVAAEAELVGTDDSYIVAVPSSDRPAVAEAVVEQESAVSFEHDETVEDEAVVAETVTTSQDTEVREVCATIVEQDYSATTSEFPSKPVSPLPLASNDIPLACQESVATPVDTFDDSWMNGPTFGGDALLPPVAIPPPTDGVTVEVEAEDPENSVPEWLQEHDTPELGVFGADGRAVSNGNVSAALSGNSDGSHASQRMLSGIARSTGNVMEALFGDQKLSSIGRRRTPDDPSGTIVPRTLLPWTVISSPHTDMWVATLQTNQKALDSNKIDEASQSLRAFSLPTEKQADSLARAWTPPRMYHFSENPVCHMCEAKFAVFRRACHCRNCGVCVCKDCATQWPSKMVPETYNRKKEHSVNVCKACDWLCTQFRLALLAGDQDKAIALHATGNVNLHTAFAHVKGELFYPVHCAVIGKSLALLEWLVDEHCCPIKSVRVSGLGKDSYGKYTAIVTSKGRSLLGISMEDGSIDIVRYLVVDKGIALVGEKDVTPAMLVRNLDAVLRMLPSSLGETAADAWVDSEVPDVPVADFSGVAPVSPVGFNDIDGVRSLSEEAQNFGAVFRSSQTGALDTAGLHDEDECIICYDGRIDCVATPCGHQICCLKCSEHISRCPVCAADCSFMRVFKP